MNQFRSDSKSSRNSYSLGGVSSLGVTVEVYSIPGPSLGFIGGREIPGGLNYLISSLEILTKSNPQINFRVHVGNWIDHGVVNIKDFPIHDNLKVDVSTFTTRQIPDFGAHYPSLQHGQLLNELLATKKTSQRWAMILDPDFFLIRMGAVQELIDRMVREDLSVCGVSYPEWYPKEYSWDLPQVYFSIYDTEKISLESIDFRPSGLDRIYLEMHLRRSRKILVRVMRKFTKFASLHIKTKDRYSLLGTFDYLLSMRHLVEPADTGWRLREVLRAEDKVLVLPNLVNDISPRRPLLDENEYVKNNEDLRNLGINLSWHFIKHGILEGRPVGKQNRILQIFVLFFPKRGKPNLKSWPPTSLFPISQLSEEELFQDLVKALHTADFYMFENEIIGFHLGSRKKTSKELDLQRIRFSLMAQRMDS